MIPYITSNRKNNVVECNADFVVIDNNRLIAASMIDISGRVKKIFSDIILGDGKLSLHDREDYFVDIDLRTYSYYGEEYSYKYKLTKHNNKMTHGIIYNTISEKYIFDWDGDGLVASYTNFLRSKHYLPVTEEIVGKVIELAMSKEWLGLNSLVEECEIFTNKEDMKQVKVWHVSNIRMFKELLEDITLNNSNKDNFDWDKVEDISDYLTTFADPIKDKLQDNVNILYDENKVNQDIFDKKEPFKGQIPVIQGGLEVLKRKDNRFLYIAGEPGTGKTLMSIKVNHVHHIEKGKSNYCTLVIAPTVTLTQWEDEIKDAISDDIDVKIIRNTNEFIRFYDQTNMKVSKPTYLLVGKETFKLSYKTKHGVNVVKRNVPVEVEKQFWTDVEDRTVEVCICTDCGLPLTNPLRKGIVYLTEKDFNTPKKSNYKCSECESVLWQAEYVKTRKTSVVDFIKRRNIKLDSTILDEAHESNNYGTVIGNATRTILQRSKKSILLSGTVSNGYTSSVYNILFALIPNTLKRDNVFDKDEFIKTYGTLMAVTKNKDNNFHITSRTEISDGSYQEIEGVNPLVFANYFANSFIFVNLEDIKDNLPKLNEKYVKVEQLKEVIDHERELQEEITKASPYNASFYNESVIKHFVNKPFGWNTIPFEYKEGSERPNEYIQPKNIDIENELLPKEKKMLEIVEEKVALGEKIWIYNDFVTNGKYTEGTSVERRLKEILEKAGFSVYVLKSTVRTIDRKKVVEKNKDKYDVFISNAKLVGTGVNMQWCNNYIFYSPTYHVNTVRQASRRGLRANSTKDNNIYHLYYNDSIENEIMERYKLKLVESESVQAKFIDLNVKRTASSLGAKIEKELTA